MITGRDRRRARITAVALVVSLLGGAVGIDAVASHLSSESLSVSVPGGTHHAAPATTLDPDGR